MQTRKQNNIKSANQPTSDKPTIIETNLLTSKTSLLQVSSASFGVHDLCFFKFCMRRFVFGMLFVGHLLACNFYCCFFPELEDGQFCLQIILFSFVFFSCWFVFVNLFSFYYLNVLFCLFSSTLSIFYIFFHTVVGMYFISFIFSFFFSSSDSLFSICSYILTSLISNFSRFF